MNASAATSKPPNYFMYFPGNYRWSAEMLVVLSTAPFGGCEVSEVMRIGARLQGKVGETLFSAAGGITRLREVQQELERQGEELFKSGGSRPKLNAAIRDYSTTVKSAKEQRVPSKEYDAARAALALIAIKRNSAKR